MDICSENRRNMEQFHIFSLQCEDDGHEINNNIDHRKAFDLKSVSTDPRLDKENDDGYSTYKQHKNGNSSAELRLEIETLRGSLRDAQTTISRTNAHMELQKVRTRQLISAWKLRLAEGEERLQRHRSTLDEQMKAVATELLRFEGNLRREQKDIYAMLDSKDLRIRQQEAIIETLVAANSNLTKALKTTRRKLKRHDRSASKDKKSARKHRPRKDKTATDVDNSNIAQKSWSSMENMNRAVYNRSLSESTDVFQPDQSLYNDSNLERCKSLPNFDHDLSVLEEEPESVFEESYTGKVPGCDTAGETLKEGAGGSVNDCTLPERLQVSVYGNGSGLTRTKSDSVVRTISKKEDIDKDGLCRTSSLSLAPSEGDIKLISTYKTVNERLPRGTPYKPRNSSKLALHQSYDEDALIRPRSLTALSVPDHDAAQYHARSRSCSGLVDTKSEVPVRTASLSDDEGDPFEITWSLVSSPNMSAARPTPKRIQKPRDVKRRNKLRSQSDATCEKKPSLIQTKRYQTSII